MMKLHLLGVNGPFPASRGATSGYLLEAGADLFQFDLGSGVLGVLTALTAPESLTALFISHWHFDHAADVPVLMYRLQALNRTLPVYGPADPDSALYRLVSSVPCFDFTEVSPGSTLKSGEAAVRVTAARHPVPAVGYTVSFSGRIFGYTGDTNTLPSLAEDFLGCDLLLADGLFPHESWAEGKPHLSAELAARLALEAEAKALVVTHLNPFIPRRILLEEARALYPSVQLAEAGAVIDL